LRVPDHHAYANNDHYEHRYSQMHPDHVSALFRYEI
jgi:hypothetical protein